MSRRSLYAVVFIAFLAVGFVLSCAISRAQNAGATREVLVTGKPVAAPGQLLQLQRVTIAPHFQLPVHIHPGMQAAWISSGVLHYVVVDGEALVTRAPVNGTPGPTETLTDGSETDLRPGDSIVETEGLIHYAVNQTDAPIEIFIASLLAEGEPGTQEVEVAATPTG
jgi:quercetin dioxygenase-like cupin family protein